LVLCRETTATRDPAAERCSKLDKIARQTPSQQWPSRDPPTAVLRPARAIGSLAGTRVTTPTSTTPWIVRPRRRPDAALRLLCFPYAGGGATAFRTWPDELPAGVELLAIEPPGRETRAKEPLVHQLASYVTQLADAIGPQLDAPFAIFGHSLGALVGFAFARELRRRGLPAPVQLFMSGRRAPQIEDVQGIHALPDPEFTAWLRRLGGIPDAVFQEPELLAYFFPILRADLEVNAATIAAGEPLDCPITAMRGVADDRVTAEQLDGWQAQTRAAFDREVFPGGHFFIQTARPAVLGSLAQRLARLLPA
jgi:medium-chain acyl-[acyl-carrier-protein] hydrolase